MDYKSNEILSSFPECLITNIINSIDLFRTFSIENFFNNGHNFDTKIKNQMMEIKNQIMRIKNQKLRIKNQKMRIKN